MASETSNRASAEGVAVKSRRGRDLAELWIGYLLILIVIWTPRPWQKRIYFVAAAFILVTTWFSFPGWKAMGLRAATFARSFWIALVALLVAGIAAAVAGWMHTLAWPGGPSAFLHRYLGYILFAFVQQLLLQDYFLPRLLRLMRHPSSAALAAAAIFSFAHLPNPILLAATLAWGFASCLLFLRYRNLYPLALAHAILGITIAMTIPGPVTRNMRVGLGYLSYPAHRLHQRSH